MVIEMTVSLCKFILKFGNIIFFRFSLPADGRHGIIMVLNKGLYR